MPSEPKTYLYVLDEIIPVNIEFAELLEMWEEDRMKPFNKIKSLVEEKIGKVEDASHYAAYFDPGEMNAVIEYMVKCEIGRVGVKIVHAENPAKAIMEYLEAEKRGELKHHTS